MPQASRLRPAKAGANCLLAFLALATGCASPPEERRPAAALTCPPVEVPACPSPVAPPAPPDPPAVIAAPTPPEPAPPAEYRGRLHAASWRDLPDWGREPLRDSLLAFARGCAELDRLATWDAPCRAARQVPANATERDVADFFVRHFDPHLVINADESTTGMVTGYYEPLLNGSRTKNSRYRHAIYRAPADLVEVDLSSVYPDLKHKRLRGRVEGGKLVPYLARGEIDASPSPLQGLEIAWVDNAVELFFLHIQGSGQVQLESGERVRVGYADQNGHPFRSLARLLVRRGELPLERTSMQGIKDWARRHPGKVQRFLNENPSYVFFKELPGDLPGPIGTLGVPLTAERSIAVDPRVVPLGVPVFLATTFPGTAKPLNRLMVAQDTGGAINGGVRADFYWGFGDGAGSQAGRMRQSGRMWVLLPKGYAPPRTLGAGSPP